MMMRISAGFVGRSASAAVGLLLLLGTLPPSVRATCTGDCSGDSEVTVDEIITMVNIALDTAPVANCLPGDSNGDGEITVDEIVAAVTISLSSCPVGTALGTRRFTLNPVRSPFTVVLSPGFTLPLGGGFRGQTNGVVEPGFLELQGGAPDASGYATIDVTAGSEYLFVDARPTAALVLCIKPILPAHDAGLIQCNGGLDFSIALTVDHHLGQIGVDGFTAPQCLTSCTSLGGCGSVESPNQVCAAGAVGDECRSNSDCDSAGTPGDGVCGLGRLCSEGRKGIQCTIDTDCAEHRVCSDGATCAVKADCDEADGGPGKGVCGDGRCAVQSRCSDGKTGNCRNDADCDTAAEAFDGVCGQQDAHPGVCNGALEAGQVGSNSGSGALTLAPAAGLQGLPVQLSIESATPCGDEGTPMASPFALTTGAARATIRNFSNADKICSDGATCDVDADCDAVDGGAGKGVCGTTLVYDSHGENFSCSQWTNPTGPGCFVLAAPTLDLNPQGGDLVTGFRFCGH
jgi:hypothetical protein